MAFKYLAPTTASRQQDGGRVRRRYGTVRCGLAARYSYAPGRVLTFNGYVESVSEREAFSSFTGGLSGNIAVVSTVLSEITDETNQGSFRVHT